MKTGNPTALSLSLLTMFMPFICICDSAIVIGDCFGLALGREGGREGGRVIGFYSHRVLAAWKKSTRSRKAMGVGYSRDAGVASGLVWWVSFANLIFEG